MESLATRKIPQSFGLTAGEITKLQDLSKSSGRSMSEIVRDAIAQLFQEEP